MSAVAVATLFAGLFVMHGLGKIASALSAIAKQIETVNTHGPHLRNYPRDTFKIEDPTQ